MYIVAIYIVTWAAWTLWVNTVGRIAGLSLPVTFVFDGLMVTLGIIFVTRKKYLLRATVSDWKSIRTSFSYGCQLLVSDSPFLGRILGVSVFMALVSILFSALVQIPLDWDGMDYHLPPLIEALQKGVWSHSENPYVAARFFPKIAAMPALWWLIHFKSALGLRGILLTYFINWCFGLYILWAFVARHFADQKNAKQHQGIWTFFVFLFWVSMPIINRESITAYADLPALTLLLAFFYFVTIDLKETGSFVARRIWPLLVASLALGLHSATKFTHLLSAMAALGFILVAPFVSGRTQQNGPKFFRRVFILGFGPLVFGSIQFIENFIYEQKPFGHFQCRILGHNFCAGEIDPGDMVLAPIIDIERQWPYWKKILVGWTPHQWVPGLDVHHGGFGWVWILPMFFIAAMAARGIYCRFNNTEKTGDTKPLSGDGWSSHQFLSRLAGVRRDSLKMIFDTIQRPIFYLGTGLLVCDLAVPALWYQRYHLALGVFFILLCTATAVQLFQKSRIGFQIVLLCTITQCLWLVPQRSWFLGANTNSLLQNDTFESARILWQQNSRLVKENISQIVAKGYPAHATHESDKRSWRCYGLSNQRITICGHEFRPVLPAYGADLSNDVSWECPVLNATEIIGENTLIKITDLTKED